jgi:hypothetical protein
MNFSDNFATCIFFLLEVLNFVDPGHQPAETDFPISPAFEVANAPFDANTVSVVKETTMVTAPDREKTESVRIAR